MDVDIDSLKPEQTCFVISPIGDPNSPVRQRSDEVYEHIIKPAARSSGLFAIRSDHISAPGMITQQVIRHILNDRMVVADLSDRNANVFYELALRHAFRKPVVQLILADQKIPFDVQGARTVYYGLSLDAAAQAREAVAKQISVSLSEGVEVESPVTIAARLEELARSTTPQTQTVLKAILDQIENLNKTFSEMRGLLWRTEDLKETIPAYIQDQMGEILHRYASEIDLLLSIRQAGIIGVFKRRETAIKTFSRYIDEESREIMIIGSSLKGLFQKEEYKEIAGKIRFKIERGLVRVKFLLTHPIVADFRASQEKRRPTEIGQEIINTLETLKAWNVEPSNVRLYLGTPTCFAIKTSHQMLVNPYPYISVSYDSPCLILEYSAEGGATRPGYFFDEFYSRHFAAWDTELAVQIKDYNEAIAYFRGMLPNYWSSVENLLILGMSSK